MSYSTRVFARPSLDVSKHVFPSASLIVWIDSCACNYEASVKVIRTIFPSDKCPCWKGRRL